jgi:hypothetical protein
MGSSIKVRDSSVESARVDVTTSSPLFPCTSESDVAGLALHGGWEMLLRKASTLTKVKSSANASFAVNPFWNLQEARSGRDDNFVA